MKHSRYAHALLVALLSALPVLSQAQVDGPSVPLDSDGDGIANVNDNFPTDASEYRDVDNDGIGDNADTDDDNDGVHDDLDPFTLSLRQQNEDLYDVFNSMVNDEGLRIGDDDLTLLDPDSLFWNGLEAVEVYFINEGASYGNELLYTANDNTMEVIFEDVSSLESQLANDDGPLLLGDGLSLGSFDGPTQLDFFIHADGHNGGVSIPVDAAAIYGANPLYNPDSLEHVIAYGYTDVASGEDWVMIGFEDLYGAHYSDGGGSDRDFNDVVIAVRGIEGTPSSWTICNITTGQWIQVDDAGTLRAYLEQGAVFPESGESAACSGDDSSPSSGSLDGEIGDVVIADSNTDVMGFTICDSRTGEIGRQIRISSAGSISTQNVQCD